MTNIFDQLPEVVEEQRIPVNTIDIEEPVTTTTTTPATTISITTPSTENTRTTATSTTTTSPLPHLEVQMEVAEETELRQPSKVFMLPPIESTIIDIPSAVSAKICSSSPIASSLSPSSSSSSSSSASSSYDTDSSTASSTCCTRHGEHIYMERAIALQHQHQHHHQQHQQQPQQQQQLQLQLHSSARTTCSKSEALPTSAAAAAAAAMASATAATATSYKSKSKYSYQKSWPIFILLISIVEISIFVYDQLTYKRRPIDIPTTIRIPTNSVFIYRPDRRLQVWRFISYMFLHANWFHLGFNVVIQLFYGIPLEVMHGSIRVCVIYLAGVFAGSLGTSVVDSDVYLVGASGGVYALLAAHLANIMLNYAQMKYAVAQLVSVIIFVFCDLGYAFYTQYLDVIEPIKAPPVSYIAHLTGALAGLTIGLLVLKNFEQRSYENVIWYLALGVYSAFTIFAIAFNLINTMTAQRIEEQGEVITQHLLHDLGVS